MIAKVINGGTDGYAYNDVKANYDPDWFGKKDRVVAGRTAESYVSAQHCQIQIIIADGFNLGLCILNSSP